MITVSATILKGDKKADGTWNVKIRVWHKKKPAYIDTIHFVSLKQLGKKSANSETLVIKDKFILDRIAPDLKAYRDWISDNESQVVNLSAKQLRDKLVNLKKGELKDEIDFLGFCKAFIEAKKNSPQASSAKSLRTVYNSLVDYFKSDYLPITEINYNFLKRYELYLRSSREITRNNHSGLSRTYVQKGVREAGLHNHMRDLRLLFNEARNEFNDEDLGIIKIAHYPFKKYKVGTAPLTAHRDRTVEEILKLRDCKLPEGSRAELARDLGMLSLYLLGMNAADLYELPVMTGDEDRINYNRAKTRNKRLDKAFFSVKIVDEVRPLLKKYAGTLQVRYSSADGLNSAIDKGLKVLGERTGVSKIDFYDFRHTVGTWIRRKCGYSTDDVAEALNQKTRTLTDIYIGDDWGLIDRMQADMLNLLN